MLPDDVLSRVSAAWMSFGCTYARHGTAQQGTGPRAGVGVGWRKEGRLGIFDV